MEVLKGPQGTLFGQNATGGSINVISAKPTGQLSAGFNTEINNFGQTMLEGFVSGPISDTLRARFAATTTQFGAWQEGYYLNHDKNGDQDKGATRLLLDWTPSDRLKVSTNFNANFDHGEQQQPQVAEVTPVNPAAAYPGLIGYRLPTNDRDADIDPGLNTRADDRLFQGVVRVDYELTNSLTLTSLTNYMDYESNSLRNSDGTALPVQHFRTIGDDRTINQELRVAGNALDSRLTYIIGGNYEKDNILDVIDENFPNYSALPPGAELINKYNLKNRAAGVFANVDFEIVPKLTLTSGARYTATQEAAQGCTYGNAEAAGLLGFVANIFRGGAGLPPSTAYVPYGCLTINDVPSTPGANPDYQPVVADLAQNEHNVSWREGLNYKPTSDSLIYLLVSRGFKAGIYPVQASILSSTTTPVKQEELTDYEIGTKLAFFDRAFLVNVSAFYYDYRNKQFFTYTPLPIVQSGSIIVNVPKSTVRGVDSDFVLSPFKGLTLRSAVTYVKTKVGQFEAYNFATQLVDVTNTEFNFAPPWSGTADAEYRFPVSHNLEPYVGASALFNSRTYGDLGNPAAFRIPGYSVFDVRAGVASKDGWRVGLFVRNLNDKYYWTSIFPDGDTKGRYAGLPRTFGINAGYSF